MKRSRERFRIELIGALRFSLVTEHKPLLTLYNKATAKLTLLIEKWVMTMQDVDFNIKYQPRKDEADPT